MSHHAHNNIHADDLANHENSPAFAGRLGANRAFVVRRDDTIQSERLAEEPDAVDGMTIAEQMDLRPFVTLALWKAAFLEGCGTMMLVFLTVWAGISPSIIPTQAGGQDIATYLGPFFGGFSNFLVLTLFTFAFGPVSGAHLNPLITLGTFVVRLSTLPRTVLYVTFQISGASLGGLLVRAGYGSRDFKTGGCWMSSDLVSPRQALAVEFVACSALLFCAFGVGLDPRQRSVIPASLAPFLVGVTLGTISWMTGYSRLGYGGAALNPARCFGSFVGSRFPGWHWHHWVGTVCASLFHGSVYYVVPPGRSP